LYSGMTRKRIFGAALGFAVINLSAIVHAQESLPALVATNFGSFAVRAQTSLTNNNPGVNSSYSLVGGGNELWGPQDKGLFGFFTTNGNFDVRVRVDSLEPVHRYAKSGLMVRESLSSAARMVSLFATPTGPTTLPADNPVGEDEVEFNFRRGTGDGSNNINLGSPGYPNAWLRLARRGSVVYGLVSRDGTNWIRSGSVDTSTWPAGPLRDNVLLGLGASSHDDATLVRTELRDFTPVTTVAPIQIAAQPTNTFGAVGSTASLQVQLADPVDARYQWYVNDTLIPGATNAVYTTAALEAGPNTNHYNVRVTRGTAASVTSAGAQVQVVEISPPEFPDVFIDFDDGEVPSGTRVFGTAEVDPSAGSGSSGGLVLTRAVNNQNGSFVIDDFNGGAPVDSFTVAFKLKIGPGSAKPADGFSFSFGTNVPSGLFTSPQQGVGPGLAVSFDLYDNGDFEAPAIDVFYGVDPSEVPLNLKGNILHRPVPLSDLLTSRYVDVVIRMNRDGKLDMVYGGDVIAYQLQTPFVPVAGGKFGFGGYAGGQNAFQAIDDVRIDTSISTGEAYVSGIGPVGNNVSALPEIVANFVNQNTVVDTNSLQLLFNGGVVNPVVATDELTGTTKVSYKVSNLLAASSTNSIVLVWSDSAGNRSTNTATFRVGDYVTLAAAAARPLGSGDTQTPGFRVRVYQIAANLTATSTFAESVLAQERGENIADLTIADLDGYFSDPTITGKIDYDVNSAPLGFSTFPGIPGLSDSRENFVLQSDGYIEFPKSGFYQMGVRSDDGFVLTVGDESNPLVVGEFEGEREPADTIFGFVVPEAGLYPFHLVYYQARGGGLVRWFSLDESGNQVLVNDPDDENALRAFQAETTGGGKQPLITLSENGDKLVLSWTGGGVLETRSGLGAGSWTSVAGATSPHSVPMTGGSAFFRVRQ
jgi:hypothetical protein